MASAHLPDPADLPPALRRPLRFGDPAQILALQWLSGGDDQPQEPDGPGLPLRIPPDSLPPVLRGRLRFGDPDQIAAVRRLETDWEAKPVWRVWILLSGPDGLRERTLQVPAAHRAVVMGAVRWAVRQDHPDAAVVAAAVLGRDGTFGRGNRVWQPTFSL